MGHARSEIMALMLILFEITIVAAKFLHELMLHFIDVAEIAFIEQNVLKLPYDRRPKHCQIQKTITSCTKYLMKIL